MAPLANDPIMSGTSIRSFRHLKHQNPSTGDDFIHSSGIIFLVPLLATMEALAPLANDPIMSGRSIWSFKHLIHQNPSIISDSIGKARMVQQFQRRRSRRRSRQRRSRRSTVDAIGVLIAHSCTVCPLINYLPPSQIVTPIIVVIHSTV